MLKLQGLAVHVCVVILLILVFSQNTSIMDSVTILVDDYKGAENVESVVDAALDVFEVHAHTLGPVYL